MSISSSQNSGALPPQMPAGNIYSASSLINAQAGSPVPILSRPVSTTRILLLSGFAPELKTRDILQVFAEWEDMNGGFRIKWIDDNSAYIVFTDPIVAKKAFLATISNMPASLAASSDHPGLAPAKLLPYTGKDTESILASVAQQRPRSGSRAGLQGLQTNAAPGLQQNGGFHGRRSSSSANGVVGMMGHARRASLGTSQKGFVNGTPPSQARPSIHSPQHSRDGSGVSPPRSAAALSSALETSSDRAASPNQILLASAGIASPLEGSAIE